MSTTEEKRQELKDSGARRLFNTGAVRDLAVGKGRCDLLPLDLAGDWLGNITFTFINEYVYKGDVHSLWFAIERFMVTKASTTESPLTKAKVLLEVSKHFEAGAYKYGDRNWEKGLPVSWYINSGVRHLLKAIDGWEDEPHDNAFVWNMICAIWTHTHFPELRDLPFNEKEATLDDTRTVGYNREAKSFNDSASRYGEPK